MKKDIDFGPIHISLSLYKIIASLLSFLTIILTAFFLVFVSSYYSFNTFQIIALLLFSALVLFKLSSFYQKLVRKYFYLGFVKRRIILTNLEKDLDSILEMDAFSSLLTNTLREIVGSEKVAILTKKLRNDKFELQDVIGFEKRSINKLIKQDSFSFLMEEIKEPLALYKALKFLEQTENSNKKKIKTNLIKSRIEVLIPLFFKHKQIGLIFLGERVPPKVFSQEGMDFLGTLSEKVSGALSNTLFYSEVRKRREGLERFYRLTVEKEIRNMELKERIRKLESRLNEKRA